MLINWVTIGAQALNFLILVWLMRRFLYKPVLHAIDVREKRIATELANADQKKAEAQKESDEFKHKNEEFDQQRAALLSKATDEANTERLRLLGEARKAAAALSSKWQETLRNEEHELHQAISRRTQREVFAIARKALTDLATTSLEERLGEMFIRRLREMDDKAKAGLAEALKTASDPVLVRSAFDLPAEQRTAIQNALNETFSTEIRIRFETAPDLISGIELTSNGQKVAWSIKDYLASMEKGVDELLKEKGKPEAEAQPEPEAKAGPKPETKADPKSEAKAVPRPEAKTEPKPETKAEPGPEVKVDPKSETKAVPGPEAKAEPKPETKAEPGSEVKADPKSEAKAVPRPEAKTEPGPKAKAVPEPEEPEPETKSR